MNLSHRALTTAALIVVLFGTTLTSVSVASAQPRHALSREYLLPSDGWSPGKPALTALCEGVFHATLTNGHARAWLGSDKTIFLWPTGYRVRFGPTELIDAKGRVVGHGGQHIDTGGGFESSQSQGQVWLVMSDPTEG